VNAAAAPARSASPPAPASSSSPNARAEESGQLGLGLRIPPRPLVLCRAVASLPVEYFRHPQDRNGKRWKELAKKRKSLALWLGTHGDPDGTRICPGIRSMVAAQGESRATLFRLLADLEELCLLVSEKHLDKKRGTRVRRLDVRAFLEKIERAPLESAAAPGAAASIEESHEVVQESHEVVQESHVYVRPNLLTYKPKEKSRSQGSLTPPPAVLPRRRTELEQRRIVEARDLRIAKESAALREARVGRGPSTGGDVGFREGYLEFRELREAGCLPPGMTWDRWKTLTPEERLAELERARQARDAPADVDGAVATPAPADHANISHDVPGHVDRDGPAAPASARRPISPAQAEEDTS
jgi:hypothetical protein